ncbi:hypothetical protein [Bordetella sp. N]|uniref:hypothetical protein n=1 Tax=Bordetella sp. N TaxID=1746199 RepID=UPI000AB8E8CF|nr:hypothetical protein [Bordetella sp. N]
MYTHTNISGLLPPSVTPIKRDEEPQGTTPAEDLRRAVAEYLGPRDDLERKCLTQRVISVIATLHVTGNTERYAGRDSRLFDHVVNYLDRPPHQYALATKVALALERFLKEAAQPGRTPVEIIEQTLRSLPDRFNFPTDPARFLTQLIEREARVSSTHDAFIKRAGRMAVQAGVVLARPQEDAAYDNAAARMLDLAARWEQQPWSTEFAEAWRMLSASQRDTPLDLPPSVTLKLERTRSWIISLQNQLCDAGRARGTEPVFLATDIEHIDALLGTGAAAAAASRRRPGKGTAARSIRPPVETLVVALNQLLNELNAALGHIIGLRVDVLPRTLTGSSALQIAVEFWYTHNVDAHSRQWRQFSDLDGAHEFALFLTDLFLQKNAYPQLDLDATVPAALATFVANENLVAQVFAAVRTQVQHIADGTMAVFQVVNQILDTQRAQARSAGQAGHAGRQA